MKNFIIFFLLIVFAQGCSTAVTVVDTTVSTSTKVITGTAKGVFHIATCPFTKKECF